MVLSDDEIPNLKHQIANKSQLSIFNDQYIHYISISPLRKPASADNDTVGRDCKRIVYLEF